MVVVGYYHLFTRRQASNKAEESVNFTNLYIISYFLFLFIVIYHNPYTIQAAIMIEKRYFIIVNG